MKGMTKQLSMGGSSRASRLCLFLLHSRSSLLRTSLGNGGDLPSSL